MSHIRMWSVAIVVGGVALAAPVMRGRVAASGGQAAQAPRPVAPAGATAGAPGANAIFARARVDSRAVERAYNDAIIKDGNIDRLVQRLTDAAHDRTMPARYRANACFVRSQLLWRHGRLAPAMAAADEGLALDAYDDLVFYRARLFDASGAMPQAREWYQKALTLTVNGPLKETIRVRLTVADAVDQNVKGLVDLAKTRPGDFRNRAAIALSVLGFNNDAADLYQINAEGSERFRQHLRVAQWAVRGGNAARAQEQAWQAVRTATLDRDRRYALSLLVEAHGLDNSLPKLIDRFAQQASLSPDEERVRIDVLRQTGQFQKAIDLFRSAHGGELGPDLRQELLRMYRDAGQDAAMVAEYRQLIAREPGVTDWPEGLSQYYLEQGDQQGARRVWEDYLASHAGVTMLLAGAESMTAFGLHDLALAATNKALTGSPEVESVAQVRLMQFDLYRRRGLNTEAEAALAALDAALPPDAPYRIELADAYERLQKPQLAAKTLEAFSAAKGGLGVDDTMRLAWLFDSVGRRDDAVKLWRDLWGRETVESRRKLIEERLLLLSAELGTLGDLAVELEEKQAAGTATPRDISLLVSIYTKVGDSVSAIEVVSAASARGGKNTASDVASLKEQAQIYLALSEYQDLARVTRRLLEIDPGNRAEYLQSLLLNQIEAGGDATRDPREQTAQLRDWLARLRQVGGDAVGAEFEAGVMDLAGFRDQAIDTYRRALALHPERADDHLLLADLLRQAGRQAEAVASLQCIAEGADTDELFLVAVDGITNMRTGNAATLKWAERQALERLTTGDDKLYLYEMVSDLAEETKDGNVYIAALENSLAHADSRRSNVLRELLAATAEATTYEASQRVNLPSTALNVAYARRLIALGEELPPEVYVDLGRTFIKLNDPAAAERAFSLAIDRTGRTSVALDAAKLFERAGFDREATRQYEKALVANNEHIETMVRLAHLRERAGALPSAGDLYLRALLVVIAQQNRAVDRGQERTPPALGTLVSFDYQRHYQVLLTGVLATLPAGAGERASKLAVIEDAFQQELRQVVASAGAAGPEPLAYYPRLTVLTQTARAVSFSVGAAAVVDRIDAALLPPFGRDARVAVQAAEERARWGFTPPAAAASPPAADAAARPMDTPDYLRVVGLALNRGDQDEALSAYRQWAKFAGLPKPPLHIGQIEVADRSPGIPEVAWHAWQRLDVRHFGSLAQYIQGLVADQDVYAEKIILDLVYQYETVDVPILTRLETTLGQPLIAEDRLMRLMSKRSDWADVNLQYVLTHLSPDQQIDVLGRYLRATDVNWSRFLQAFGMVLRKPLDAAHAAGLLAVVKPAMQTGLKKQNGPSYLANFMNYPFTAGVHADNAPIVDDVEQFLAEKFPQSFKVGYFKASLLRDIGRDREALTAFVDAALKMYVPLPTEGGVLTAGAPSPYAYQSFVRSFGPFIFPKYKADVMTLLDEREAGPAGLTDALISLRIELNNSDPAPDPQQFLASLQAIADRQPRNEMLRNMLYPLYDQWGDTLKAAEVLTELTKLRPDNRTYRYRLVLLWQKLDRPEKVVEVVGAQTVEDLAPVVQRSAYIESISGPVTTRFPMLKRAIDRVKAAATGGDMQEAALGLRTLLQVLPPAGMSLSEYSQSRDDTDPYFTLRDLLLVDGEAPKPAAAAGAAAAPAFAPAAVIVQAVAGGAVLIQPAASAGAAAAPSSIYDRLMTALEGPGGPVDTAPRPARLLDVAARYPFAIAELESYVNTIRAGDIDAQYVVYNLLADAYVNNGRAEAELSRRTPQVQAGTVGRKDAVVWLALASRQSGARAAELVRAAEQGGLLSSSLNGFQLVLLARLYAAAGRPDQAVDAYMSVATTVLAGAASTIQPNTLSVDPYGRDTGLLLFTGLGLFDEARQRLDADSLNRFVSAMLALGKPPANPIVAQNYARFALVMYVRAIQAGLTIESLRQVAPTFQVTPSWTRPEALQSVFALAHEGRVDDALRLLQTKLQRDVDTRDPITAATSNAMFAARQYQVALGLSGDIQMLGPFGTSGIGIEEFKPLFPVKADAWPGGGAWVARVARELPAWIEQRLVNRDAGVQLLSLLTVRLQQMGDTAGAAAATRGLSEAMRAGRVSIRSATLAVSVADKAGAPIDLAVVQDYVRANRLHISREVGVITRTAQAQGPEAALRLGEIVAGITSNDELLKQLVTIAQASGNAAEVQRWTERQRQVTAARAQLARKPPGK
jgi:Tfp pilus assembly protein PilF